MAQFRVNLRRIAAAALTALAAGCATQASLPVTVERLSAQQFQPTPYLKLLYAKPTRPYTVIARLKAQGQPGMADAQVIAALQKQAQALGAQGLIVNDESEQQPSQLEYNPTGGNYNVVPASQIPIFSGLAVRWKNGS